jgi:hypothetical protein
MIPGFGPATEVLFLREKDPKPLTPRQTSLDGSDANPRRANQLAALKQGLLNAQSVRPLSLSAGVGQGKERKFSGFSQTKFQGSTSGSTDAKIRLRRSGHNKNSLALWHGRAVQPTPGKCAQCLSVASLRAAGVGEPRREPEGPQHGQHGFGYF